MVLLSDKSAGRDNNLNLIRALAATAVLVSHAYPIALGEDAVQPLYQSLGHTLGTLSVYVFFIISGFLIAMSYDRSRSKTQFVAARVLRLMPGLLVSLLLVAFVIGPMVTTLPLQSYLGSSEVWTFMARNLALIKPQFTLPGVFETLPYPTIEGSIWTLFYEVACYVGVFIVGIVGLLRQRRAISVIMGLYILGWAVKDAMGIETIYIADKLYTLSVPFVFGMLIYLWQDRIPLSALLAVALIAVTALLRQSALYELLLLVTMAYVTFWLAYIPGGILRAYNRLGDYSYGIYIYAFPMQGLAIWMFGPMSPMINIALSLPMTVIPSVLSWHYIEKPALDLRKLPVLNAKTAR
jgi:peptidoglycan/LPS O-acetylase OafA/YrhL